MMRVRSPFLVAFLSSACILVGDFPGIPGVSDWQPVEHIDEGEVCFEQDAGDVLVEVSINDCLSSSCSRNFEGICTATVDGTEITLQSDISWEQDVGPVGCTDDCGFPVARCTIEDLPDGTYTVQFGGETVTVTVPVDGDCKVY